MIPYGRQDITQADIDAVVDVLRSDFLTQGPVVPRFEAAVASRVGARHAIAMNSATSALHAACIALDLGPGDLLWTVPNTFVASANCARYCGADVDFVDIDAATWNMSVEALREKLVKARRAGRMPKVVIPVHFSGQPTDQREIHDLSQEYGFRIIEDASHSIGATGADEPVGNCRWSDITVLSFHPVKVITSTEGGMALTNDPALAQRLADVRSHGITRDVSRFAGPSPGAWYYEQQSLGFNFRLTDVHAALGLSQLDRLDGYVAARNTQARRYDESLADLPLQRPTVRPGNRSAFHLYVVRLTGEHASPRDAVFTRMRDRGIGVNVHYVPVHLQPYYRALGFAPGLCPEAERHGANCLTIPLYPALTVEEQQRVTVALRECLR